MKQGEELQVPLVALFTDKILAINEATKVAAEIQVEYSWSGKEKRGVQAESRRLYDRNAMTWDDDRKVAAFVTAEDPTVLRLAKNDAGQVRREGTAAINQNLSIALGLFQALSSAASRS